MIVVFGSLNMDFVFALEHLPGAGETALARTFQVLPGGKGGNQAVAAARDGADVRMVGCVGHDAFGDMMLASLAAAGVDTALVRRTDQPTGCASVSVDARGENAIVVAQGANLALTADALPADVLTAQTIVLLQMEVAGEENWRVLRRAKAAGARTVLNVAPAGEVPEGALQLVDVLIVNRGELAVLTDDAGGIAGIGTRATSLAERHGLTCIVTLGADGVCAVDASGARTLDAFPVDAIDSVGAGDTFAGVLAAAFDRGETLEQSLRRATVAAALACTRPGAQPSIPDASATADALARDTRRLQAF